MSESEVELARRGIEAYNAGDIDGVLGTLHPDVELVPMRALLDGQAYHGHDGARRFVQDMAEEWESIHIDVEEIRDLDGRLLVLGRFQGKGRASGIDVDAPVAWISVFKEGTTILMRAYGKREEAFRALGLDE